MLARSSLWKDGGDINSLPQEVLSFPVRELPRTTLVKIANLLNRSDVLSASNWESLAEQLGYGQSSVLDHFTQEARVQNTYPGLLMLQKWAGRPGSTSVVLLHALRDIQREDVVRVLVENIFELHTMQLSVSVQDRNGFQQFLRVRTRKSAPLHASLENLLQNPIYWYDIMGPRHDLDWGTPAGDLQGTQVMLKLRSEPNQDNMSQLYGSVGLADHLNSFTPPYPLHMVGPSQTCHVVAASPGVSGGQKQGQNVSQLQLNIPPHAQNNISVTIPTSKGHAAQLNVKAEGPGVRLVNKPSQEAVIHQQNTHKPVPSSSHARLSPPPACGLSCQEARMGLVSAEIALNRAQPMTNIPDLSDFDTTIDESESCVMRNYEFSVTPKEVLHHLGRAVGGGHNGDTFDLSQTVMKEAVAASHNAAGNAPRASLCRSLPPVEHDENAIKPRGLPFPIGEPGTSAENCSQPNYFLMPQEQQILLDQRVKMGFVESKIHNVIHNGSETHTDLTGAGGSRRFGGGGKMSVPQPASPPGHAYSQSAPSNVTLHLDYVPHSSLILFCNTRSPQAQTVDPIFTQPPAPCHTKTVPFKSPRSARLSSPKREDQLSYVPHSFIVHQAEMHRSASAPSLDMDSGSQRMQTENEEEEGMEFGDGLVGDATPTHHATKPPPQPCGYSSYRPDLANLSLNLSSGSKPLKDSLSVDVVADDGYMDMSGTSHQYQQRPDSPDRCLSPRRDSCMSLDSYLTGNCSDGDDGTGGGGAQFYSQDNSRRQSEDNLAAGSSHSSLPPSASVPHFLHHPRNRHPYPNSDSADLDSSRGHAPASTAHQPRSRCPLTEADAMLLDDPQPHYMYIDVQSARGDTGGGEARLPQRSHGGVGKRRSSGFHRELPESELLQVPGWNPTVNEKSVEQEMTRYINDDGNFIVWRYIVGGKYVISISHLRRLRHYAVYETERDDKVWYYIFPKGPRLPSLRELVMHCQYHGVSEHTKTFKTPEGGTHRGTGRCLHVRLRTPVPVRTRFNS